MKISFYNRVSLNIVAVFATIILVSFIPESFHDFFGDWKCEGSGEWIKYPDGAIYYGHWSGCNYADCGQHDATYHWGYRHWIWMFMGLSLFIVQVVRIIKLINKSSQNA